MNKLFIGLIILIVAVGGGYFLYQSQPGEVVPTPPPPPPPAGGTPPGTLPPAPPPPPPAGRKPTLHTISMVSNTFSPDTITIKVGDTVIFKNSDVKTYWPASGIHPTHQLCPGFDALSLVRPGETYSHTFTVAKECPFHDHLNPGVKGKIIVTE